MTDQTIKSTGCCEPFNPEPWQDKEIVWKEKLFVKDHVASFLHNQNVGKWVQKMTEYVVNKGKNLVKLYFSYTTCPKCVKVYSKNYVVLFAKIN